MNSTGSQTDLAPGAFAVDSRVPGAATRGFDVFRRGWQTQIGDVFPLPAFSPATIADFRLKGRVARVRDVVIADLRMASATRIADPAGGDRDLVEIHVLRRGAWTLGGLPERYEHTVSTGQFLLRHFGRSMPFETAPHTTAQFLFLPSATLRSLLGNRTVIGSADSAEMRLLTAHMNMIQETATDFGPAGVHAAHSTLIELAKAVAVRRFDDVEPQLAPALVRAAKDLANRHLADRELSPAVLARELNVSVRTL